MQHPWSTIKWNTIKQGIHVFAFFLCEMFVQIIWPSSKLVCLLLLLSCTNSLYILATTSLSGIYFVNVFLSICGLPAHFTACFEELVYFYTSCYPHAWFKLDTIYWIKALKVVPFSFSSFLYLATLTDYLLCGSLSSVLFRIQQKSKQYKFPNLIALAF